MNNNDDEKEDWKVLDCLPHPLNIFSAIDSNLQRGVAIWCTELLHNSSSIDFWVMKSPCSQACLWRHCMEVIGSDGSAHGQLPCCQLNWHSTLCMACFVIVIWTVWVHYSQSSVSARATGCLHWLNQPDSLAVYWSLWIEKLSSSHSSP